MAQRDSVRFVLISENKIRRATSVIDSLDLYLGLLNNRLVDRDSTIAQQERWWQGQYQQAWDWGDHWKDEATSWWTRNLSAFWVAVGVIAAALAGR